MNFSLDAYGRYATDDPDKLNERLVKAAQIRARAFAQRHPSSELLVKSDELVEEMLGRLQESPALSELGVEIIGLSILSIKALPEMTKALQAKSREHLLLEAGGSVR